MKNKIEVFTAPETNLYEIDYSIADSQTINISIPDKPNIDEIKKAIEKVQQLYEDVATSATATTTLKVDGDAVDPLGVKYYPFHTTGQGYWSKCKYCKETGLEFKNKYIAYCPHCRAMFKYKGE